MFEDMTLDRRRREKQRPSFHMNSLKQPNTTKIIKITTEISTKIMYHFAQN